MKKEKNQISEKDRVSFNDLNNFVRDLQEKSHKIGWSKGYDFGYDDAKRRYLAISVIALVLGFVSGFYVG